MNRILIYRGGLNFLKRNMSTGTPPQAAAAPPPTPTPEPESNPGKMLNARYRPSDFEKIILVWTKKFKSRAEVPSFVSYVY